MKEHMKLEDEAALLWPVLIFAAGNQQVPCYSTLEGLTGIDKRGMGEPLGLIYSYCERKNYPPLNSIAVNRRTGKPGGKYPGKMDTLLLDQRRVFAFNWKHKHTRVPRAADFREFIPKLARYKKAA